MLEIERKFLVKDLSFLKDTNHTKSNISQGYLIEATGKSLRVRIKNDSAYLTIKFGENPLVRQEFEYRIDFKEGLELLNLCPKVLKKVRYVFEEAQFQWEVDVFQEGLEGLCLAEIELEHPDQVIQLPNWIGEEVTHKEEFLNINLIQRS